MSEFLHLITPEEAWERWRHAMAQQPSRKVVEEIPLVDGLDRVLAKPVQAPEPLPPFQRSTVDGFAVRAADTFGAGDSLPAYLKIIGEMPMGVIKPLALGSDEAVLVHTGGALPQGADAVVMLEDTQRPKPDELEVFRSVAGGENVLAAGEDLGIGDEALSSGRRLRPQDLGGLAALGITKLPVVAKPKVGILSTGDELVPPEAAQKDGQVRDVNSTTLAALTQKAGGQSINYGIIPDDLEALKRAARRAKEDCDVIVITAGSSVSERDRTADVIDSLGSPGVLVHGLRIKPGKPTILGVGDGTPALGLPGNPVSALVIAGLFLSPLIRSMLGQTEAEIQPQVGAQLKINLASKSGREDYVPVRLIASGDGWQADPVFGRSNLIFTLVRADGLLRIPPEVTGLEAGAQISVTLF